MRIEGSIYHVPKPESDQDKTETDSVPRYTTKYYSHEGDERRPPPVGVVDRVRGTSSEVVNLLLLVAASLGPRFLLMSVYAVMNWKGEIYFHTLFEFLGVLCSAWGYVRAKSCPYELIMTILFYLMSTWDQKQHQYLIFFRAKNVTTSSK